MNVGLHHVADRFVNQPVPPYDRHTRKSFRDEQYGEMPMTARRSGVARVQVAVVGHLQLGGLQGSAQTRLEPVDACRAIAGGRTHGSTFTKGRTSCDSNTPSVT